MGEQLVERNTIDKVRYGCRQETEAAFPTKVILADMKNRRGWSEWQPKPG